jgi:hypothetical protein
MAFRAPHSGTYTVELHYARRRALAVAALIGFALGLLIVHVSFGRRVDRAGA